jgi:hypothetical protein
MSASKNLRVVKSLVSQRVIALLYPARHHIPRADIPRSRLVCEATLEAQRAALRAEREAARNVNIEAKESQAVTPRLR